jgi:F0F1-type ATP synthase assembly protein I
MPADQPSNGPSVPIGFMVAGSEMASFTLLGLLIDYLAGTMPGFTIGLTLLGVGVAFWHLLKMSQALAAKKQPPSQG